MQTITPSSLATLPVGSMIGVYETERSRKFLNLYRKIDAAAEGIHNPEAHSWEVWWAPTHCVGYFAPSQIYMMVEDWERKGKDIRVNNRISR